MSEIDTTPQETLELMDEDSPSNAEGSNPIAKTSIARWYAIQVAS